MKFLLIPGNNSLSHVAKCLALEAALSSRGHQVLIAVSRKHAAFLHRLNRPYVLLPDLQETDDGALPALAWFRRPDLIEACIQAEINLLNDFRPDRVLGVFRFTLKVSATVTGIPYDSLACGCMMPDVGEVLGYAPEDGGMYQQAQYLLNFFRFAGKRMSVAMKRFHQNPVPDIRHLLMGERTFLWDFPEFMPLVPAADRVHVGPLSWQDWADERQESAPFPDTDRPLALLTLGTRSTHRAVAKKAVRCLLNRGYDVMVAAGGQQHLMDLFPGEARLRTWEFTPLQRLLRHAALLVCHGGQMTIFEALQQRVPVLVIPFQPEQAHNGICLERMGCGRRLAPAVAFKGNAEVYEKAFTAQPDSVVEETISGLAGNKDIATGLARAALTIGSYGGASAFAELLVAG